MARSDWEGFGESLYECLWCAIWAIFHPFFRWKVSSFKGYVSFAMQKRGWTNHPNMAYWFQVRHSSFSIAIFGTRNGCIFICREKMLMGQWYQALSTNQRINCGVSTRMFCCFVPAKLPFFEDPLVTKHGLLKAPKYRWISQSNVQIFPQSKPQEQPHFRSLPQFGCVARIVSYQKLDDKTWRRRVMNRERQVMKGGRVKGVGDGERRPSGFFF